MLAEGSDVNLSLLLEQGDPSANKRRNQQKNWDDSTVQP